MAAKKTDKKESRFFIVKTVNDARESIEHKVKTYREKYISKRVEAGREFFTELREDPFKAIDDLIYEGRESFNKVKSNQKEYVRKKVKNTKKEFRGKIDKVNQKTRQVYEGIGNDAKMLFEDAIDLGKKNLDKIPMKKSIEKKISAGMDAIPSKLNLPSKVEIDNLVNEIDDVNKKVDALTVQHAGA